MVELTVQERLQPSLLDRLTDENPATTSEPRTERVLSLPRLRQSVLRDVGWLLNTTRAEATQDMEACPEVQRSVLNYGVPDFAGVPAESLNTHLLEAAIKQAVLDFEPRILRKTLRVTVQRPSSGQAGNSLALRIEGQLWAQPAPLSLILESQVDLERRDITIRDANQ